MDCVKKYPDKNWNMVEVVNLPDFDESFVMQNFPLYVGDCAKTLDAMIVRRTKRRRAAISIQRWYIKHYYNPRRDACRKRLEKEMITLGIPEKRCKRA